jgi:hypothetical protein
VTEETAQIVRDWGVRFSLVVVVGTPILFAWLWLRIGRWGRQ